MIPAPAAPINRSKGTNEGKGLAIAACVKTVTDEATPEVTADQKKKEHEAAEALRKAEWEAKQAEKKAVFEKALQELLAMSDDDVANASVKRAGDDLERLTRRNMKMCVTEIIQTMCLDDPLSYAISFLSSLTIVFILDYMIYEHAVKKYNRIGRE